VGIPEQAEASISYASEKGYKMPANKSRSMTAMMRLWRMVRSWRRRRVARRRGHLHNLMGMSDRTLADIGVRRADVQGAISGVLRVDHIARTHGGLPWMAEVHALHPQSRAQAEAFAASDLTAAA
jgi:uncharacterized protein YjiS (DUF1127 family)